MRNPPLLIRVQILAVAKLYALASKILLWQSFTLSRQSRPKNKTTRRHAARQLISGNQARAA
jgi:hypothetical protein